MADQMHVLYANLTGRPLQVAPGLVCSDGVAPVRIGGERVGAGVVVHESSEKYWRDERKTSEWWSRRNGPSVAIVGSGASLRLVAWEDGKTSLRADEAAALRVLGNLRHVGGTDYHLFADLGAERPMTKDEAEALDLPARKAPGAYRR